MTRFFFMTDLGSKILPQLKNAEFFMLNLQ